MNMNVEDKIMVTRNKKEGEFSLFYPSSCYKNPTELEDVAKIFVKGAKGKPQDPNVKMKGYEIPIIIPTELFGGKRMVYETQFKKAHLTAYVPVTVIDSQVFLSRKYHHLVEGVKKAIYEYVKDEYLCKKRIIEKEEREEYFAKHKDEVDKYYQEFVDSFDGFSLNFGQFNICGLKNYAGYKDGEYEMIGVDFYRLDREASSEADIEGVKKAIGYKKRNLERAQKVKKEK